MSSSILDELLSSGNETVMKSNVKTRGEHLIVSALNLIEDIRKQYDPETADMLERRLIAAIKTKDPRKFRFNKYDKNT